jgi:hypothetical protein
VGSPLTLPVMQALMDFRDPSRFPPATRASKCPVSCWDPRIRACSLSRAPAQIPYSLLRPPKQELIYPVPMTAGSHFKVVTQQAQLLKATVSSLFRTQPGNKFSMCRLDRKGYSNGCFSFRPCLRLGLLYAPDHRNNCWSFQLSWFR